jgi:ParB/Sulfiredoxin domain
MDSSNEYSVGTARAAAERGELGDWVATFLASPGSDNAPLGAHLLEQSHSWLGPTLLPIGELHRLAGPAGDPVMQPLDDDEWRDDVEELAEDIERGADPPPVIVTYRDDRFVLEDGNHRVEALRRAGEDQAWSIVAFTSADDRDRYEARSAR